jgi:hypothetical protein
MSLGIGIRNVITKTINFLGSDVVITPYTQTSSDEGYSGQASTDGTSVTERAVLLEQVRDLMKKSFGNLDTAGFQLVFKYTAVFDMTGTTRYKVIYDGDTYDINKIDSKPMQNVNVCYFVTLSKRLQ